MLLLGDSIVKTLKCLYRVYKSGCTGKSLGNAEIMEWTWSGYGEGTSVHIMENIGVDKFSFKSKFLYRSKYRFKYL